MTRPPYQHRALAAAAFVGAAWVAVALIVIAVFDAAAAATGWLIGFVFWAQIVLGALTLTMIHRLTGGRWGEIAAPAIAPAAAATPLLILLAIPVFVAIPVLYPWPAHPASIKAEVLSYYLDTPWFVVRSMVALIGWSALSVLLPRYDRWRGQLLAGVGLVFHALVISSVSIDWFLSREAPFTSSSFGAGVAIASLVAALAWTAVVAPAPDGDPAVGDIGSLLLTTILGITYIDFMAVLVIWYGDMPREEAWFVARGSPAWLALGVAAFVLVCLLPFFALLLSRVRNQQGPLRAVGACVLVGLACYNGYMIAPPAHAVTLLIGLLAIVGIGLGLVGVFMSGVTALIAPREVANAS